MTTEAIEEALQQYEGIHRRKLSDYISIKASVHRKAGKKALYISENLRKVFAILLLSGHVGAIDWFWEDKRKDSNLPIAKDDLPRNGILDPDDFYRAQRMFPPKICPLSEMRRTVKEGTHLPFQKRAPIMGRHGLHGQVFAITIDPEFDCLHTSSSEWVKLGNVGLSIRCGLGLVPSFLFVATVD